MKIYDIDQLSKEYLAGLTTVQLGIKYNVNAETIRKKLKYAGIKRRGCRKYFFNDAIFKNIDTEEKAYWLGFIYADGNVYKNTLSIKLGLKDCEHLKRFGEFIEYSGEIEIKKKYSRIRVYSPNMCKDLLKLGIYPNKGKTIIFPNIKDFLYNDFIRGFFDGDGWITSNKKQNYICFSSCSLNFIKEIKQFFEKHLKKRAGSIIGRNRKPTKHNTNYTLTFGGNLINKKIANLLWKNNSLYLLRKNYKLQVMT